jgi:hypothetical protein
LGYRFQSRPELNRFVHLKNGFNESILKRLMSELLVDTANMASEKVLIQGVSGVCADLVDHTGGAPMRFRHSVGMLEDVTDDALEMGFDTSQTYPAIRAELDGSG